MSGFVRLFEELSALLGSRVSSLEFLCVLTGAKNAARLPVSSRAFPAFQTLCADSDLYLWTSDSRYSTSGEARYQSSSSEAKGSTANAYREAYVAAGKELVDQLQGANKISDHRMIGRILGYPACCVDFFMSYFALGQLNGMEFSSFVASKRRTCDFEINVFARELDAAYLSHFPCSLQCSQSVRIAGQRRALLEAELPELAVQFRSAMRGCVAYSSRSGAIYAEEYSLDRKGAIIVPASARVCISGRAGRTYSEPLALSEIARVLWGENREQEAFYLIFE